jgi:thiamine-phosphate pyrophosphorylase
MMRCAITDGSRFRARADRRESLLADAARWAGSGIEFVQLRERHMDAGELVELARAMVASFRQHVGDSHGERTRLLINGRPDIAIAAGADGVQLSLRQGSLTPAQAREVFAASSAGVPFVGLSCHTVAEVEVACAAGADLILFAPVFEKRIGGVVVSPGTGLAALRKACAAASGIPVLALGGVNLENAAACLQAGAAGVAGIRLFGGD